MQRATRIVACGTGTRIGLIMVALAETTTGQNRPDQGCPDCSVVVSQRPTCPSCAITAQPVAVLTGTHSAAITIGSFAVATRNGGYVVGGLQPANRLLLFPTPRDTPRVIAGSTSAPGPRFAWVSMVTSSDGELVVFGDMANRLTPRGAFLKAHRFLDGARIHGVIPRAGGFIVQASVNSPDRVGLPFHFVDQQGVISKSFGLTRDEQYRQNPFSDLRWIASATGGSFWSSELTTYRLRLWNERGELVRELERRPEWFEPWDPSIGLPRTAKMERPRPVVLGISADGDSLLWVLVQVADKDWKQSVADTVRTEQRWTPDELGDAFDSIIEVLNVRRGTVVATQRFGNAFMRFVGPQEVMERTGNDKVPALRVVRLVLHPQPQRKER